MNKHFFARSMWMGLILTCTSVHSAELFWGGNGTTQGGSGLWDTTNPRWGSMSGGPFNLVWDNENEDSALFGNSRGDVTIATNLAVKQIIIENAGATNFVAGGGTVTFSGEDSGVYFNATTTGFFVALRPPLTGESFTKTGAGTVRLFSTANTIERYVVNQGALAGTAATLGAPSEVVTNFITLNGGDLGLEGTAANLGANRGIYLGTNGGRIAARSGATFTVPGPITGPGSLTIPSSLGAAVYGANITNVFSNTNNNYEGATTVNVGMLRLGASEVLPDTTTLNLIGANARLNLNGFSETISNVVVSGANSRIINTGVGGTLIVTDTFDLRQSGSGGNNISAILDGPADLIKTTANNVELSAANIYTGDTTVSEGTLALVGSGSFNNSSAISIAAGATLSVNGRSDGTLHLGSSQTLSGSGTVSGAISVSGTVAPGDSVGTLNTGNQTWNGGGTYEWKIANVSGTAGTHWDSLAITGNLDVQATSENKFAVTILPVDEIVGFDNDSSYSWPIAAVSGEVSNFNSAKISVNDTAVTNDLAGGVFAVNAAGGSVNVTFTPNPGPAASPRNVTRASGLSVKIPIASLLADSTSHADGSARELAETGEASNGTVTSDGAYIYYTPANNSDDSFTYTVRDVRDYREGDTVRTAQSSINISVVNTVGAAKSVTVSAGSATVSFAGIPGFQYEIQRSTDLEDWVVVDTITAPANGLFQYVDQFSDPAPASVFYRLLPL